MSEIGMLLLSQGQVRTLRRKHHPNSFLYVKLANTIILITKIRSIIVPQLLKSHVSLKLIMMKKNQPSRQKNHKMLALPLQLKQKGKEEEKEKVEKVEMVKDKQRRARAIDNSGSVQSALSRPHCKYMVLREQKNMFTFLRTPMD